MTASDHKRFDELEDAIVVNNHTMQVLAKANIELTVRLKSIHAQLCKINRQLNERVDR